VATKIKSGRKPSGVSEATLLEAQELVEIMRRRGERLDADSTNMLALALEHMRAKVYSNEYPELRARMLIPVETDVPEGAESFSYEEDDFKGAWRHLSGDGYAQDAPTVETHAGKVVHGIEEMGGSAIYTLGDMRRAAMSGRDLIGRKFAALRRTGEQALDRIAAFGLPSAGIATGLLNKVVGTSAGQIRGTAMTAASWDATPDAIGMVTNLNQAVTEFVSDSKETRTPDTLVLPIVSFLRLSQTYTTDGSPQSALQRFLESNGFVRKVVPWNLLSAVDGGGANQSRGLLMNYDADVCSLVVPQEFRMLPIQPENFAFKGLATFRTAGTCVYRPLGLRYLTGLPTA
jgi:hypothetical protein